MVAAVSPSSPPVATVQEPQLEKKADAENGKDYGGLPPAEKVNTAVRKMRNREITSKYKAATTAPPPPTAPLGGRRNPSPLRQSSPSSRQSSPVKKRSTTSSFSTAVASDVPLRHPSPNLGRSSSNVSEVPKRALSAERRRPWPAVTASDSKMASTSSTADGLASSKARTQSRGPELWPSMASSKQATESSGISSNGSRSEGRDKDSSQASDHTLKPAGNGVHRPADSIAGSPQRKGSPVRRQSTDQAENARPTENSHIKPDHQRWPGMSTGKVFGGAMSRSMDLSVDRERPLTRSATMLVQGRPGTPSSRHARSTVSRSFNRSVNEGPSAPSSQALPRRNPTPTRGRTGTDSGARENVANSTGDGAQSGSQPSATGEHSAHSRRLSQESVASVDMLAVPFDNMSDTESVSSGGSGPGVRGPGRGTTVPARVWQDMSNRLRRFSEGDPMRASDTDLPAVVAPIKTVRRSKIMPVGSHQSAASMLMNGSMNSSMNGSMTSAWALSPGRVSSNSGLSNPQPPSSPQHSKGSSPLRGLPSPQRSRPAHGAATAMAGTARTLGGTMLNFGIDGRSRGKKAMTQQEEAQLLRILHNRWLQWRFVNARAESVMAAQKASAERQLYNVWVKTSELRTSVAMQRIKLQQARQAHKLHSILSTHAAHLEDWESLEEEHSTALTGCMEALESAILRVPVTGGAKADVQAVKEALGSAVDVLNAVESSVNFLAPKAESMEILLSQLAETAAQERALLEECGDLLSVAASLEVEERSLRTHLVQLESEKQRVPATQSMNGNVNASNSAYLSTP